MHFDTFIWTAVGAGSPRPYARLPTTSSYTPISCLISYVSFVYCIISVITQTASRCIIALLTYP